MNMSLDRLKKIENHENQENFNVNNFIQSIDLESNNSFDDVLKLKKVSDSEEYVAEIDNFLENFENKKTNNFFSQIVVNSLKNKMDPHKKSNIIENYKERLPFKISKNKIGIFENGELNIYNDLGFKAEDVIDDIVELRTLKEQRYTSFLDYAYSQGYIDFQNKIEFDGDKNILSEWRNMFEKEEEFLSSNGYFGLGSWSGDDKIKEIEQRLKKKKEYFLDELKKSDKNIYTKYLGDEPNKEKYPFLVTEYIREEIQKVTGLDIRKLTIQEQFYFLDYVSPLTVSDMEDFKEFYLKFGIYGIKTFLSIGQGGKEMGENILKIGENYKVDEANKIFAKYAEIVDEVDDIEDYLKTDFENPDKKLVQKIREDLLVKAKDILVNFSSQDISEDSEEKIKSLLDSLENIKGENLLLISKFRALKENGLVRNIEDLNNIEIKTFSREDTKENEEILFFFEEMYQKNYKDYSDEGVQNLIDTFYKNLAKENSKIYSLQEGDKILSAILVNENLEEKSVYMSALNVDPGLKETAAGRVLLENEMNKYLENGWEVRAEAAPDNAQAYINLYEFVAYEADSDPDEDYILQLKRKKEQKYVTKDKEVWTKARIKEKAQNNVKMEDGKIAVWMSLDEKEFPKEVNNGFVITQMFRGKKEGELGNYFLLEKEEKTA